MFTKYEGVFSNLAEYYLGDFRKHPSMHIARRDGFTSVTHASKTSELPPFARAMGDIHTLYRSGITRALPALDNEALTQMHPDIYACIRDYHDTIKQY